MKDANVDTFLTIYVFNLKIHLDAVIIMTAIINIIDLFPNAFL